MCLCFADQWVLLFGHFYKLLDQDVEATLDLDLIYACLCMSVCSSVCAHTPPCPVFPVLPRPRSKVHSNLAHFAAKRAHGPDSAKLTVVPLPRQPWGVPGPGHGGGAQAGGGLEHPRGVRPGTLRPQEQQGLHLLRLVSINMSFSLHLCLPSFPFNRHDI